MSVSRLCVPLIGLLLFPLLAVGATERVSLSGAGTSGDRASSSPVLSADGRFAVFTSDAANLVPNDPHPWFWGSDPDIFVRDRLTGTTELLSGAINSEGYWWNKTVCRNPDVSGDGSLAVFECYSGYHFSHGMAFNVFLHDRSTGLTLDISEGYDGKRTRSSSHNASISDDGRFVAFESAAYNIVPGDENGRSDIFLHDLQAREPFLISLSGNGIQGNGPSTEPAISADGNLVAFVSEASNLAQDDGNAAADIFLLDRREGTLERILAPGGAEPNGPSRAPTLSGDGRFLAFISTASNLVPGDGNGMEDVFLYDREKGAVLRASSAGGTGPALDAEGRRLVFASAAAAKEGDSNGQSDVFLFDRGLGTLTVVSISEAGSTGSGASDQPSISGDGRHIAFASTAPDLVEEDTNGVADIFVVSEEGDTVPPEVSITATPGILWPPNKKYVDVLIDGLASDDSGSVTVVISVTDEYGEMVDMFVPGLGSTVALESWRYGDDLDGRIYTLTAVATDAAGNQGTATAEVVVPHDIREKKSR